MFELTFGELALVIFLFALTWGAGRVPRIGERVGEWVAGRARPPVGPTRDMSAVRRDERRDER